MESLVDLMDSNLEPAEQGSPERNLLAAVLKQAALDIIKNRADADSALIWIHGVEEWSGPKRGFTFREVCEALDLDPATVRKQILKKSERRH